MSTISASAVKELREMSGAGMMDCKKALTEASGNLEDAIAILRKTGIAKAQKKSGRSAKEGLVFPYIHPGSKLGVLLEINCETDFVANTDDFKDLCKDISMHIAASAPMAVTREEIPSDILDREKFVLDCGHHVTFNEVLGNNITVYNGKELRITCAECGY